MSEAFDYAYGEDQLLRVEEWQHEVGEVPLYCSFPQPKGVVPITLSLGADFARIGDLPLKLSGQERFVVNALATNRVQPIGFCQLREYGVGRTALEDAVDKLRTLEPVVLRSTWGREFRYRLADRVIVAAGLAREDMERDYRVRNPEWRKQILCAEVDEKTMEYAAHAARKRYCAPCPVREDCLASAILAEEKRYLRGGLSGPERIALIKEHKSFLKRQAAEAKQVAAASGPAAPATPPDYRHITAPVHAGYIAPLIDPAPVPLPVAKRPVVVAAPRPEPEVPTEVKMHLGPLHTANVLREGSEYARRLAREAVLRSMDELRDLGAPIDERYYADVRSAADLLRDTPPELPDYERDYL